MLAVIHVRLTSLLLGRMLTIFLDTEPTMRLWVLIGNTLYKPSVPQVADLYDVFDVLITRGAPSGIMRYLGKEPNDQMVTFYRLVPPVALSDINLLDDEYTVSNAEAVLSKVEKVVLNRAASVDKLFGARPDRTVVSLYIEKLPGKIYPALC